MGMINKESGADCGQSPVGGVEEGICGLIVLRAYPLALENAPQRLDDVEVRRGFSPWAFPYTLISCANADKKRLNVDSLASFLLACCQASRPLRRCGQQPRLRRRHPRGGAPVAKENTSIPPFKKSKTASHIAT